MDHKHEKSLSTLNEKNDARDIEEAPMKILTVQDLATVAGGAIYASEYEDKIAKCRYGASGGAVLSPTPILSSL